MRANPSPCVPPPVRFVEHRFALPVVPLFILLLAGCSEPSPVRSAAPARATPVAVVTAALHSSPSFYQATGTVAARFTAGISAKWSGYVREVRVRAGDPVREGELLVVLDARDLDAASNRAAAGREEVRGAIREADASLASAKANLDLAEATYRRMSDLYDEKSISDHEFDQTSAARKSAQAAYDMARGRRAQLDARLTAASEDLRAAQVNLGYSEIRSPFNGVVAAKSTDPGNLAVPGMPLLTVEGGGYRFEAQVDESKLPVVRRGQPVSIALDGAGSPMNARVSEIVASINPASRAYTVRIDLPRSPRLRSGLFGRAAFPLGNRQVLSAPSAAIVEHGQLQSVFVADAGVARMRLITAGAAEAGQTEILSGLEPGDKVVFPVPAKLSDGDPIEVLR